MAVIDFIDLHAVTSYVVKPVHFDNFMLIIEKVGGFWALMNELPSEKG